MYKPQDSKLGKKVAAYSTAITVNVCVIGDTGQYWVRSTAVKPFEMLTIVSMLRDQYDLYLSYFVSLCRSFCLQVAEGQHEELTQRGETEKKELEQRIGEMEDKEQALQARIEALQADNDFTNERLTALQGNTSTLTSFKCISPNLHYTLQCIGMFCSQAAHNK